MHLSIILLGTLSMTMTQSHRVWADVIALAYLSFFFQFSLVEQCHAGSFSLPHILIRWETKSICTASKRCNLLADLNSLYSFHHRWFGIYENVINSSIYEITKGRISKIMLRRLFFLFFWSRQHLLWTPILSIYLMNILPEPTIDYIYMYTKLKYSIKQ